MAEQRWRRLNGAHLLPLVRAGVRFVDGVPVEREGVRDRKDAPDHATRSTTLDNTVSGHIDSNLANVVTNAVIAGNAGTWRQYESQNQVFMAYQSPSGSPVFSLDVTSDSVRVEPVLGAITITVASTPRPQQRPFVTSWTRRSDNVP